MVTMKKFQQIRLLIDEGLSNTEISRQLQIHRATVRKYRKLNQVPGYKERARPTKVNPLADFEPLLEGWLKDKKDLDGDSIFSFLKTKGYVGSLRTVYRRIAIIKSKDDKERFFEQKYTFGEQAQFDFKEKVTIQFRDKSVICHLFIATLPASGKVFAKAFPNKTYEAFAEGFHSFFEEIGGLTDKFRCDNLSPVVKKVLKGSDRIYTQAFQNAINYYGFKPSPCGPGKGNHKGDVERDIKTCYRRIESYIFLHKLCFFDFNDFNEWLYSFSRSQLSEKQKEYFAEEKKHLKPLPQRDECILCHNFLTTVTKHGTIKHADSIYSVPDYAIEKPVKVVVSAFDVKIYQISPVKRLIAQHSRVAPQTNSILLAHSISSLVRKPQAMIRWAHRKILFPEASFDHFYQYLKKIKPYSSESEYLKSLNLIHHTTLNELKAGIEIILESGSLEPFADLKYLLNSHGHSPNVSGGQPPLNTDLSQYDSLIPT